MDWLEKFIKYHEHQETSSKHAFWAGVSVLSSVYCYQSDQMAKQTNLSIILVSDQHRKSTLLNAARTLLNANNVPVLGTITEHFKVEAFAAILLHSVPDVCVQRKFVDWFDEYPYVTMLTAFTSTEINDVESSLLDRSVIVNCNEKKIVPVPEKSSVSLADLVADLYSLNRQGRSICVDNNSWPDCVLKLATILAFASKSATVSEIEINRAVELLASI